MAKFNEGEICSMALKREKPLNQQSQEEVRQRVVFEDYSKYLSGSKYLDNKVFCDPYSKIKN